MVLYTESNEKLVLIFDARATNNKNWFSADHLRHSPWQDIFTASKNFFSIAGSCIGDHLHCRTFFINHQYYGCQADAGWLMIGGSGACPWEARFSGNSFQYSKVGTYVTWNTYGR